MANPRKIAVSVLLKIENDGAYSNLILSQTLKNTDLDNKDKSLVSALVYGVLDRKITLDYILGKFMKTPVKKTAPFTLCVLRVALYQIMYMDKIPDSAAVNEAVKLIKNSKHKHLSGFVNGVLRSILREGIKLPNISDSKSLSVIYSCPEWIIKSFIADYGFENTTQLLEYSLHTPPVTLRVNKLKTNVTDLTEILLKENISVCSTKVENALEIVGGIDVTKSAAYLNGLFHVQDISSQTVVSVLAPQPNENVLDICAAPGGKTFTMAQYMKNNGKITACDLYEKRVELIQKGANRLGITNIKVMQNDATAINNTFENFDAILCDVPCSGLGVIRRKPEIKYKDITEYKDITLIQSKILENSAKYLKQNGRILYSTCTLRKCENEDIIQRFLDKHPQYELKYQRTFMPHIDGSDGFYCALLQKSR